MSKDSVYVEQRQPLRSIEFDEWTLKERAKSIHETSTQRQQDIHELTHLLPSPWCSVCMSGEVADDHHWKRQDAKDSGLKVAPFDHCDILAEVGMFNMKLKSKVLVSHRSEEVATVERPKDVIKNIVRVICNGLEIWTVDVCSFMCQKKMAEIILQSAVDRMRQVKTIWRSTMRYLDDSLSYCESAVKESEEQIRAMPCHTHMCDRDRYAAWLITRYVITDDERLLLFKLMSKDYHREVMKCSELNWFHSTTKQPKLGKQWTENHLVTKLKRVDGHLVEVKGWTHSTRVSRRKLDFQQWS